MPRPRRARLAPLVALVAAGCAHAPTPFVPVEAGPVPAPAAVASYYELRAAGRLWGDLRIWAPGALRGDEGRRGVLALSLRLRNTADLPLTLELERLDLEVTDRDGELHVLREPPVVVGDAVAAPGALARLGLEFPLPAGLDARDVAAFELTWSVRTPGGRVVASTPFARERRGPEDYFEWYQPVPAQGPRWWHGPFWPRPSEFR